MKTMTRFRSLLVAWLVSVTACQPSVQPYALDLDSGTDSGAPFLALTANGDLVISFLATEGDTTSLRYSILRGEEWSKPRVVATGGNWLINWADFPSVVPITETLWSAHWLVKNEGAAFSYDAYVSLSNDAGTSWGEPIRIHTDQTLTEHGFVSLYPNSGQVGVVWLDGRAYAASDQSQGTVGTQLRAITVKTNGARQREVVVDPLVCDCCQTDVAISQRGPVVAYRNRSQKEVRDIYVSRFLNGRWDGGRAVANDGWIITGCPVNGPAIDASGSRLAVAWFTAEPAARVRVALSGDNGTTFAAPLTLSATDPLGRVDVVLGFENEAWVSWLERGSGQVNVQRIIGENTVGNVMPVLTMNTSRNAGFPKLKADSQGLVIAWTEVTESGSQVRTQRVGL